LKNRKSTNWTIHVRPQARKPGIERLSSGEYKIHVLSPPQKGEANREVIKTLASIFDVSPSCVRIIKGQKSRRKLVSLEIKEEILKAFEEKAEEFYKGLH
jgi:uncharacterized protein (TIGR00251 family)